MPEKESWINWLCTQSESKRQRIISSLDPAELEALDTEWCFKARPEQVSPPGEWNCWLIQTGRGWGKTRTGAESVIDAVRSGVASRVHLVARAASDVRDVMVEGESGILSVSPPGFRPEYEPSKRRLTWPNGAVATTFSSEQPDQLRGPQCDFAWCDELASWRYTEAWDMLLFGLRLGIHPRVIVTTTPRPRRFLRDLAKLESTITTTGSTMENRDNLSPVFIKTIFDRYGDTHLGRQELEGELLDEIPGALFTRKLIEQSRVKEHPPLERIVVAVDPATTGKETSDESGIVVVGRAGKDFFVLADLSLRASPDAVCRRAIFAYQEFQADRIVFEANQGGDTWRTIINGINPQAATKNVHASRGKFARAEPVAARYEQGRVRHVGVFSDLEDQMCNYLPGDSKDSPDRMDALVWAVSELDSRSHRDISIDPGENFLPQVFF
ncbi:ATP-binding protein [Candidatus Pacearchaeota archaeon]|nr:ATP-binding protein [Candidatus Pacearchaeota archaeon]